MANTRIPAGDDNWHATIDVVIAASADKVWALASNWLGFPSRCMVECLAGQNYVPGCVRRVQAHNSSFWVTEKLSQIDHQRRILTYDLVGGNSGIDVGYKSALQVMADGESRARVVWHFMFGPEQRNVDSLIAIVEKKIRAHITELEELAQEL